MAAGRPYPGFVEWVGRQGQGAMESPEAAAQAVFRNETHSRNQMYVIKQVERTWRDTSLSSGGEVWWRDRGRMS